MKRRCTLCKRLRNKKNVTLYGFIGIKTNFHGYVCTRCNKAFIEITNDERKWNEKNNLNFC